MHTNLAGFANFKSHLIRFNFDGSIGDFSEIANDTLGITFFSRSQMIKSLDGNFVHLAVAQETDFPLSYLFVKLSPEGDTVTTEYLNNFYLEDGNIGKNPLTLFQAIDSTYYGLVEVQNEDDFLGGITFFRLNKKGILLHKKSYFGISIGSYNALASASMIRYDNNRIIIGAAYRKDYGEPEDIRHYTKLLIVDTLGNLIDEHTYWEDTLALDCFGLTKTVDGGLLYTGRIGRYYPETNGLRYKGQVVKLNSDLSVDWKLLLGRYTASIWIGLRKILPLNNEEFVAVGFHLSSTDRVGWLIKFNIDGEVLWERKYFKVPHFEGETNFADHELYDVDTTNDGGFVMVGHARNYYEDNGYLPGQKAWLVKTNPYGCIVPGCQFGDKPADTEPKDTAIIQKPPKPEEPKTWVYPNPATESLFYYHHQDEFNFGTAYIYNSSGQLVQKWDITVNDVTYEIDVSGFASGQYVLQVLDGDGVLIEVERFVKI